MRKLFWLALLLCVPVMAVGQHAGQTMAGEMKKLDFLVGQWRGEGWTEFRPGQRETFQINESVQRKVDGAVLLIDGLGTEKKPGQQEEKVVHKAFAVVDYDTKAKQFRFRAYRAGSGAVDVVPQVGENLLIWGFKDERGGEIRFTVKLNEKGQWFEIGEYSMDGKTWHKFLEMTLSRLS